MFKTILDWRLLLLVTYTLCVSSVTFAAVYKWTDAEGNVHFSDRPVDNEEVSEVDVQLVNEMDGAPVAEMVEARERREANAAEAERRQAELAAKQPKEEDPCASDLARYKRLSGITISEDGRRTLHYLVDENGKAVSEKAQQAEVKELEQDLRARGCL